MTLPNFVVLGPPRTATTWLFRCLKDHPQVYLPNIKQVHFFDKYYTNGLDWYKDFYHHTPDTAIAIGDITPDYLSHIQAPQRIRATFGDQTQLFLIVRDPVNRAYSDYRAARRRGDTSLSFSAALQDKSNLFVENGLYAKHIYRYLDFFPPHVIHLLAYENLINDAEAYLRSIYNVLHIDAFIPDVLDQRINRTLSDTYSVRLNQFFVSMRKKIEASWLGRETLWTLRDMGMVNVWHRLISKKEAMDTGLQSQRADIFCRYFSEDALKLEALKYLYVAE